MSDEHEAQGSEFDWEGAVDVTSLSQAELERVLERLVAEEREVSYKRRVLQGRIDLIRTELVGRDALTLSPDDLARVIMDASATEEASESIPPDDTGTSRSTE
ncbi:MAG TPA: hypothetical protein VK869_15065 [Rubrobacteraceae bacterium]|nr:hypothetical protein [Rubrobacteraceae bacterium]